MDQFGIKDNWDFRLETGRQRSIQITSGGGSISMPPNSIAVLDIELRNTGNSVDDIRARAIFKQTELSKLEA